MNLKVLVVSLMCLSIAAADLAPRGRRGRQESGGKIQGGIDFTGCVNDPGTGFCCIEKDEEVTSLQKDPILECTHKNIEKCHYTYITQFDTAQEEVCEENFEKSCQVSFKQQAFNETIKKCYKPLEKTCDGSGPQTCKTLYESSCTTRYVEKQPGKFVGDTKCEKLPVEICGAGCTTSEGAEECHDKVITSLVDVPEETCDLNPQKTCRFVTRLVPKLKPKAECTQIPKETCQLKFSQPQEVKKILKTRWCQDPTPAEPGDQYQETPNTPPLITDASAPEATIDQAAQPQDLPGYEPEGPVAPPPPPTPADVPEQPATLYDAPPRQAAAAGARKGRKGRNQGQRAKRLQQWQY